MHENFRQFCNSGATLFQEKTDRAVILAMLNILKAHFHMVSRDEICFAKKKRIIQISWICSLQILTNGSYISH